MQIVTMDLKIFELACEKYIFYSNQLHISCLAEELIAVCIWLTSVHGAATSITGGGTKL